MLEGDFLPNKKILKYAYIIQKDNTTYEYRLEIHHGEKRFADLITELFVRHIEYGNNESATQSATNQKTAVNKEPAENKKNITSIKTEKEKNEKPAKKI